MQKNGWKIKSWKRVPGKMFVDTETYENLISESVGLMRMAQGETGLSCPIKKVI